MGELQKFLVSFEDSESRLDLFLTAHVSDVTRSFIQRLIADGQVTVNEKVRTKTGFSLTVGDLIQLILPAPVSSAIIPEDIPLDILFEDDQLAVINKARGMVVHPAAGNQQGTLVNALLAHCQDLSGINGVIRPGIVHRLDKDTSGVMLVAKTDQAHVSLAEQISNHTAGRIYLAVVHGNFTQEEGQVEGAIGRHPKDRQKMSVVRQGGKAALTHYKVLERLGRYCLVSCKLETGRTHQIRVHMAFIGHPVVGDPKYGPPMPKFSIKGQALHSSQIHFVHPRTGEEMTFTAPLPQDMQVLVEQLRRSM
ncbi:MAG TPA: RluA family pseudouridine synthase [Negativicutes bacterium]|nr:RluA family pseudouridine synthase [Negativicutes bacterium]